MKVVVRTIGRACYGTAYRNGEVFLTTIYPVNQLHTVWQVIEAACDVASEGDFSGWCENMKDYVEIVSKYNKSMMHLLVCENCQTEFDAIFKNRNEYQAAN